MSGGLFLGKTHVNNSVDEPVNVRFVNPLPVAVLNADLVDFNGNVTVDVNLNVVKTS